MRWLVVATMALAACQSREPSPRALVVANCLSCHGEDLLAQQRLTPAQWTKVVKKMVTWGAPLEPENEPLLVAYLAKSYGPETGPYAATVVDAGEAQNVGRDDAQFANGEPERGRELYTSLCATCHGPQGRGGLGVNLVDRPLPGFATTVRRGRGKMPPLASVTDGEIADLLAHLRRLR